MLTPSDDSTAQAETGPSLNSGTPQETITGNGQTASDVKGRIGAGLSAQVRSWTIGNVTTAATLVIFAFILVKVMVVSRGEPATARALIEGAAPVAVVMDAFFTLGPMVIAFLLMRIGEQYFRSKEPGQRDMILTIAFMILQYLSIAIVPLVVLGGSIVGTFAGAWTDRRNRRKGNHSGVRLPMSNTWTGSVLGLMIVLIFTVINSGPWVPTENVSLKDGRHYVAYVISSHDGWVTLFDAKKRQVIREQADNIESREICGGLTQIIDKPLSQLPRSGSIGPHYPRCDF
jgi:hypothetical protein